MYQNVYFSITNTVLFLKKFEVIYPFSNFTLKDNMEAGKEQHLEEFHYYPV
jgi:hypothetical protein